MIKIKSRTVKKLLSPITALLMLLLGIHANSKDLEWAVQMGGMGDDGGSSIAVDDAGNVYTTGAFRNISDFDPGPGTFSRTSAGNADIFVQKLRKICTTSSNINEVACNDYTSPSGNYIWNTPGTYIDTIPNIAGCDSIITINLTLNSTSSIINPTICSSYLSPSGNYIWNTSGTYYDTIPNTAGCDSIITINLTLNNSNADWVATGGIAVHGNTSNAQDQVKMTTTYVRDGVICVWRDNRSGTAGTAVYAQKIDPCGNLIWGCDGVLVSEEAGNQQNPRVIHDGADGAIFTWEDKRFAKWGVYAQHISGAGVAQWTPNGVWLSSAGTGDQRNPVITTDGSGGAIVAWEDDRSGKNDVYAQRIDAFGNILWSSSAVAVCTADKIQDDIAIETDSMGGAVLCWNDNRTGSAGIDFYAERLGPNGIPLWGTLG